MLVTCLCHDYYCMLQDKWQYPQWKNWGKCLEQLWSRWVYFYWPLVVNLWVGEGCTPGVMCLIVEFHFQVGQHPFGSLWTPTTSMCDNLGIRYRGCGEYSLAASCKLLRFISFVKNLDTSVYLLIRGCCFDNFKASLTQDDRVISLMLTELQISTVLGWHTK